MRSEVSLNQIQSVRLPAPGAAKALTAALGGLAAPPMLIAVLDLRLRRGNKDNGVHVQWPGSKEERITACCLAHLRERFQIKEFS